MRIRNLSLFATFMTISVAVAGGCTQVKVHKVSSLDSAPRGIRVFSTKVYLFVDTENKQSQLLTLPDMTRAYDLEPVTVIAKQDFSVELTDGQLAKLTSNQDTTALLTFLSSMAETAQKAGATVSQVNVAATFGLSSGIYVLDDDGNFKKLNPK